MRRSKSLAAVFAVLALLSTACGDDSDDAAEEAQGTNEPAGTALTVVATDYAFDAPETVGGGTVEMTLDNQGQEAHFAGLARVNDGATYEQVAAAMSAPPSDAPPSGPPPFTELAGVASLDPGKSSKVSFSLQEGTYALFCFIPSPDGVPHAAKGMVKKLEVTESAGNGNLPETEAAYVGKDFAYPDAPTELPAGEVTVGFNNSGEQLHEINLVQLSDGKAPGDVVSWFGKPAGPPPMQSLGGVAIAPGSSGTATFNLEAGQSYAVICAIPDVKSDFAPHVTKGMISPVTAA